MQASFWQQKWEKGEIGFHEAQPNPLLLDHIQKLHLISGDRVFLPLCGKTLDIGWLMQQGFQVVGVELSELAITELFAELGIQAEIQDLGPLKHYHAQQIDIFVGDIFELNPELIGSIQAIYDRAALVALPPEIRQQYAAQLKKLSLDAAQLVVTYEYDQTLKAGPPFAVTAADLSQLYAAAYNLQLLQHQPVTPGRLGSIEATESVWLLQPLQAQPQQA